MLRYSSIGPPMNGPIGYDNYSMRVQLRQYAKFLLAPSLVVTYRFGMLLQMESSLLEVHIISIMSYFYRTKGNALAWDNRALCGNKFCI
jgi:hypothetical protein